MRRMSGLRWLVARATLALALAGLAALQGPAARARGLSQVAVTQALNGYPQPELGGQYAAELLGYYKDVGLSEHILPYDPKENVAALVARGTVSFGMMAADSLLEARARGLRLVAVMAALQISPQGLMWHAGEHIRSLADLSGHTVIRTRGAAWWHFLQQKYRYAGTTEVDTGPGLTAFDAHPDGVLQCDITSEPFIAHQTGRDVRWALTAEAGWDPYQGLMVTSEDMIRAHPDTVRAFVAASLRGWRTYVDDPRPTLALLESFPGAQQHPLTPDAMLFGFLQMRLLVTGGEAMRSGIGVMSEARFDELRTQLASAGIPLGASDPNAAFTLAFLPH